MDYSLPGSSVHGISRQGYWSGWPFPSPGDLPDPGIEPRSLALQADSIPTELQGKPLSPLPKSEIKHLFLEYFLFLLSVSYIVTSLAVNSDLPTSKVWIWGLHALDSIGLSFPCHWSQRKTWTALSSVCWMSSFSSFLLCTPCPHWTTHQGSPSTPCSQYPNLILHLHTQHIVSPPI